MIGCCVGPIEDPRMLENLNLGKNISRFWKIIKSTLLLKLLLVRADGCCRDRDKYLDRNPDAVNLKKQTN